MLDGDGASVLSTAGAGCVRHQHWAWPLARAFSLAMLLTYSVVMGVVYDALNSYRRLIRSPRRRGRAVVLGSLNEAP